MILDGASIAGKGAIAIRRATVVGALIAAFAGLTACASRAESGDRHGTLARTPGAAAIGFDEALRGDGGPMFGCLPGKTLTAFTAEVVGMRGPTATVVRKGVTWTVTVAYTDAGGNDGVESVYEVRRRGGGYCVSKFSPDGPADLTTEPTSSPPSR